MRFGGPVFGDISGPDAWVAANRRKGFRAAYCPIGADADDDTIRAYEKAAHAADLTIAEVGAWSNPLSPDSAEREKALAHCRIQLELAERIGARCCVNISGSRGEKWDGPHPANLTNKTFDLIVETVRGIIDAVKPERTYYCLETMPWAYPDSPDSYERLVDAIDRRQFAVHFDPANLLCSPQRYYGSGALIREFVDRLGQYIKSCHAKDILLADRLTTHLDEVRAGLGGMDYRAFLESVASLDPDVCVMLEHLPNEAEYDAAAAHIRGVANDVGVVI
jgi:sugar phosphate isomerase/epimerase